MVGYNWFMILGYEFVCALVIFILCFVFFVCSTQENLEKEPYESVLDGLENFTKKEKRGFEIFSIILKSIL